MGNTQTVFVASRDVLRILDKHPTLHREIFDGALVRSSSQDGPTYPPISCIRSLGPATLVFSFKVEDAEYLATIINYEEDDAGDSQIAGEKEYVWAEAHGNTVCIYLYAKSRAFISVTNPEDELVRTMYVLQHHLY